MAGNVTNRINWNAVLRTPGAVDLLLQEGLVTTPTAAQELEAAYVDWLAQVSARYTDDDQLTPLAEIGIELTRLTSGTNGADRNQELRPLLARLGAVLETNGFGNISRFGDSAQTVQAVERRLRTAYRPRQVPRVLDHIDDAITAIDARIEKLDRQLEPVHSRITPLRGIATTRQEWEATLRLNLGETRRDGLNRQLQRRREFLSLRSDLLLLKALITGERQGEMRATIYRILTSGGLSALSEDQLQWLRESLAEIYAVGAQTDVAEVRLGMPAIDEEVEDVVFDHGDGKQAPPFEDDHGFYPWRWGEDPAYLGEDQ